MTIAFHESVTVFQKIFAIMCGSLHQCGPFLPGAIRSVKIRCRRHRIEWSLAPRTILRCRRLFRSGIHSTGRENALQSRETNNRNVNLTDNRTESKTGAKIVCRACKLSHVASDMDCPNCGFWCSPSCYETFWKKDEAERQSSQRARMWQLLGSLVVGTTLGVLGWGHPGAMFWLFEVLAFLFVGFIPALLLL